MDIHQMQVRYDPNADRVLWQLRTVGGELFAVWLTRRMMQRVWPPFQAMVTQASVARVAPGAIVLPEARDMLAQAARERPLPAANFDQPFDPKPVAQPLGPEPLLATTIDLTPGLPGGALAMRVREAGSGRSLELRMSDDLATALSRLIDKALADADWGLAVAAPAPESAPAPVTLN
jgi:hypothetical protein